MNISMNTNIDMDMDMDKDLHLFGSPFAAIEGKVDGKAQT